MFIALPVKRLLGLGYSDLIRGTDIMMMNLSCLSVRPNVAKFSVRVTEKKMVHCCSGFGCTNRQSKVDSVKLHRIPINPVTQREAWICNEHHP